MHFITAHYFSLTSDNSYILFTNVLSHKCIIFLPCNLPTTELYNLELYWTFILLKTHDKVWKCRSNLVYLKKFLINQFKFYLSNLAIILKKDNIFFINNETYWKYLNRRKMYKIFLSLFYNLFSKKNYIFITWLNY